MWTSRQSEREASEALAREQRETLIRGGWTREEVRLKKVNAELFKAAEWALDMLDIYDRKLIEMGEPEEKVYAAVHIRGKKKARAAIARAMDGTE